MIRLACYRVNGLSETSRCVRVCLLLAGLLAMSSTTVLAQLQPAQTQTSPSAQTPEGAGNPDARLADVERRLDDVSSALTQTQQMLEKSLNEIQQLRAQVNSLRAQTVTASDGRGTSASAASNEKQAANTSDAPSAEDLRLLREEQAAMQAEIKQHDQIKVETDSKYPLRVKGLALFNAFSNAGVVDNAELPTVAFPRNPGSSHGSVGGTFRQTLLTLQAIGPKLGGARSSAEISMDFFGGTSSNVYGYTSAAGLVRMRDSSARLDWDRTSVQASFSGPLISPLSPTSYATVASPALSGSGNLWAWSPQLSIEQRVSLSDQRRLVLEAGLIDPPSSGYTAIQLDSPVEASRRPGYEGRVSYRDDRSASVNAQPFALGIGAYSSSQFYNSSTQIHSWAVTADWQLPISRWFALTGEAYRGRALGGLGGGAYKDTLTGTSAVSGLARTIGVDAVGGWSQLKLRLGPTFEANAAFGLDNAFSSNFDGLVLAPSSNPSQAYARNDTILGNIIFRPKTYLIFSPEYRRILSWRYTGPANVANVFTLSAGYAF